MNTSAQQPLPTVRAGGNKASLWEGDVFHKNGWTISPHKKPDFWDVMVEKGKKKELIFITDIDCVGFTVELPQTSDFLVLMNNGDSALTRIRTFPEPVTFTAEYISAHDQKIIVEIPVVYELVNIVLALTQKGKGDPGLLNRETGYYHEVMKHFGPFSKHGVVIAFDSLLREESWHTFNLKMDAYTFDFKKGRIMRSMYYDRLSGGNENILLPFMKGLEQFAKESEFREFYRQHTVMYQNMIKFYQVTANINEMKKWLDIYFPGTPYHALKIIFSPLSGTSHAANWFVSNGFLEAQAYVNFPYPEDRDILLTEKARILHAGIAVFAQLSHAYLNPETDHYAETEDFREAFKDPGKWLTESSTAAAGYSVARSCFNEYMNWSLVCIRYGEEAPDGEKELLISRTEKHLSETRGFKKFKKFNRKLSELYNGREPGQPLAALYPAIIRWCREEADKP